MAKTKKRVVPKPRAKSDDMPGVRSSEEIQRALNTICERRITRYDQGRQGAVLEHAGLRFTFLGNWWYSYPLPDTEVETRLPFEYENAEEKWRVELLLGHPEMTNICAAERERVSVIYSKRQAKAARGVMKNAIGSTERTKVKVKKTAVL